MGSLLVHGDEVANEDFPTPGKLNVIGPDGRPVDEYEFETYGTMGWESTSAWQLQAGARVRVTAPGYAPMLRTLDGPSPWTLHWGRAILELSVNASEFSWLVDGILASELDDDSPVTVCGLDPGPHTVVVTSSGRVGRAMRVQLRDGERRELVIDLRPSDQSR